MSDSQASADALKAQAHEEVATRNSKAALAAVEQLRAEMVSNYNAQSNVMQQWAQRLEVLEHRVNVMFAKHMGHGSTTE